MKIIETISLSPEQKEAIRTLWNKEYPANLALHTPGEFELYLSGLNECYHLLLQNTDSVIAGWAFSFYRAEERWFAIILDRSMHRKGKGTALLNLLKARENKLSGWVADHDSYLKKDGSRYESPLSFYLKNGFITRPNVRLELGYLSAVKIEWQKQ